MTAWVDEARRAVMRVAAQAVAGVGWSAVGVHVKAGSPGASLGNPAPTKAARTEESLTAAVGSVVHAGPSNYLTKLGQLKPGDTLMLESGHYGAGTASGDPAGLPIVGLHGTPRAPIVITGPETGARPVLLGRSSHNTIQFVDASHVVVRRLEIDGRGQDGFGVAVRGPVHDITIEDNHFHGHGADQSVVAISTSGGPAWNWIIRRNLIVGAGTGMYLGSSTGGSPFVAGLIEHNVVRDTLGYNVQIKHQGPWSELLRDLPAAKSTTVIRHNVFAKSSNSSTGSMARPNLLVGDGPPSGPGASNDFAIYGNFFYRNPTESLFQGEGNVALYGNLMVADRTAARIQPHNGLVRAVSVFHNTVVSAGKGIVLAAGAGGYARLVLANAVFSVGMPIAVMGAASIQNVTDTRANAVKYLNNPLAAVGSLDLYPKVRSGLRRGQVDLTGLHAHPDWNQDFNGRARDPAYRGAYSGEGTNSGWGLGVSFKP